MQFFQRSRNLRTSRARPTILTDGRRRDAAMVPRRGPHSRTLAEGGAAMADTQSRGVAMADSDSDSKSKKTPSAARIRASRENGRKSRGPRTPQGKAKSRYNGVKHGLCAATLI